MAATATRLDKLAAAERTEIEEILVERRGKFSTERFVSDEGDTMAWYLILFLAAVLGIIGVLAVFGLEDFREFADFVFADPPMSIIHSIKGSPHVPGFFVAVIVAIAIPIKFLRVHGRHGWMATAFALVRIRSTHLRVVHYVDIARLEKRVIRTGRRFSLLVITTLDGRSLTGYTGQLFGAVKARVPATAKVIES